MNMGMFIDLAGVLMIILLRFNLKFISSTINFKNIQPIF